MTLYIHIPFCRKKCFYCSFSVGVAQEHHADAYLSCVRQEAQFFQGEKIDSVFIGGGTPTLLSARQLTTLFEIVRKMFSVSKEAEITIESNPETLDLEKCFLLRSLGVSRVSLGVQSFNDKLLTTLGRNHDAATAKKAFNNLRQAGFENINLDMMFSCPGQTDDDVRTDLQEALSLAPEHLSVYSLTVEKFSRFCVQGVNPQSREKEAATYSMICDAVHSSGLEQYEISNFARRGFASRHNINYWQAGNYIGLGMSAHSHRDGRRYWNVERLKDYMKLLIDGKSPQAGEENLSPARRLSEALSFGLRMTAGVDVPELEARLQCHLSREIEENIERFVRERWLIREKGRLKTTLSGRIVLDSMSVYLLPG